MSQLTGQAAYHFHTDLWFAFGPADLHVLIDMVVWLDTPPWLLLKDLPSAPAPSPSPVQLQQLKDLQALTFPGAVYSDQLSRISCPEKDKYF